MQPAVALEDLGGGVVQLTMQDREYKNTFSTRLITGLIDAYQRIAQDASYKVVVITGYGTYFACGGTKEGLLALYEGKSSFTDINMYSLALDCRIPVIAAMQGHAIGGGFVMGLYSDFVILSMESIYTANFMKYGFTPGLGATFIVPKKLGLALGEEILMTASNYRGWELQKRGIPFPVFPRTEVVPKAIDLARQIAEKPRGALVALKDHLVRELRDGLPAMIQQELLLHKETFHSAEVKDRIESLFGT